MTRDVLLNVAGGGGCILLTASCTLANKSNVRATFQTTMPWSTHEAGEVGEYVQTVTLWFEW